MKFDNGVILSYTKLRTLVLKLSYPLRGATKWSLFDHLATCCLSGHDPRMGRRISVGVLFAVLCFFTACDSSSSSADPDPIAEVSSSSVDDENLSSSSVTDKGTSSGGSSKSSSSVKSGNDSLKSSSSGKKNNSSSSEGGVVSSSDATVKICNDGDLDTTVRGTMTIFYECKDGLWEIVSYVRSSSSISSSDAHYDMTEQFYCNGYPECENASEDFTDPRDKQVYKTLIFQQKATDGSLDYRFRIFASNLNYGKQIMSDVVNSDDNVVEKYCYNDDEWYCDNGFGGMYTWSEAMGLPKACDSLYVDSSAACIDRYVPPEGHTVKLGVYVQRQGICPGGWHIMNGREWLKLSRWSSSGLGSSVVWARSNSTGFSALPTGWLDKGEYKYFGEWADFHEPQEFNHEGAKSHDIVYNDHKESNSRKDYAASVRCVEDYEDPFWK